MFSAIRWKKVWTYFTVGHRKEYADISAISKKSNTASLVWLHYLSYYDTIIIIMVTIIIMINTSRMNCHMLLWQPIKCVSAALLILNCCGWERDLNVYIMQMKSMNTMNNSTSVFAPLRETCLHSAPENRRRRLLGRVSLSAPSHFCPAWLNPPAWLQTESQGCGRTRGIRASVWLSHSYLVTAATVKHIILFFSFSSWQLTAVQRWGSDKSSFRGPPPGRRRIGPIPKNTLRKLNTVETLFFGWCSCWKEKRPEMIHYRCLDSLLILKRPTVFNYTLAAGLTGATLNVYLRII